jgi:hypothetical protein
MLLRPIITPSPGHPVPKKIPPPLFNNHVATLCTIALHPSVMSSQTFTVKMAAAVNATVVFYMTYCRKSELHRKLMRVPHHLF